MKEIVDYSKENYDAEISAIMNSSFVDYGLLLLKIFSRIAKHELGNKQDVRDFFSNTVNDPIPREFIEDNNLKIVEVNLRMGEMGSLTYNNFVGFSSSEKKKVSAGMMVKVLRNTGYSGDVTYLDTQGAKNFVLEINESELVEWEKLLNDSFFGLLNWSVRDKSQEEHQNK
jgi:hypothetical protein